MPRIIADYKGQAKALIVQAGLTAFTKSGYRNTTMAEIAKAVGVTKGNLYHYFPSKIALLREIVLTLPQGFLQSLIEGLGKAHSPEALANVIEQIIDQNTPIADIHLWFDLMAESSNDPELEALLRTLNYEYLQAIKMAIAQFQKSLKGVNSDLTSDDIAMSVMFLLHGVLVNIKLGTPQKDIRGALRVGIESILG